MATSERSGRGTGQTYRKDRVGKPLDDFSSYLRQERALAPSTVANYVYLTKKFLKHRFGTGPVALSGLTAAQVVGSVQRLAPSLCRKRAKMMTSALRSFHRYAWYQDFIRSDLAACVRCVADWSVASIPERLDRPRTIARIGRKDTGQARCVANFQLAWLSSFLH
jgi:site-specific recombinase XerC